MAVSDVFVKYLEDAAGLEKASVALASISSPGKTSIRSNPLKPCSMAVLGGHASAVPWAECGLFLEGRPVFTLDPCFHAGAYYVQDSSSMFVGHVFSEAVKIAGGQGIKILDLCAAPGGKTTDIASRMPSGSVLVANEVVRQRASVLKDNVKTWGHPDVIVTSSDPSDFGRKMKDYFDIILVDAPCSGEGMFRKDRLALEQWSEDAVALCSARQKRILADVWPSLKPGGMLIYSTCTFARDEDECQAENFLATHAGYTLLRQEKGISQRSVAKDLGISQALLSHYENGIREPGLPFVVKACDYYGVSADFLLGRTLNRDGTTIVDAESLFDYSTEKDNVLRGSIMATLSKKLLVNSIGVLFDLLGKLGNKRAIKAAANYLSTSVYQLYRHLCRNSPSRNTISAIP